MFNTLALKKLYIDFKLFDYRAISIASVKSNFDRYQTINIEKH